MSNNTINYIYILSDQHKLSATKLSPDFNHISMSCKSLGNECHLYVEHLHVFYAIKYEMVNLFINKAMIFYLSAKKNQRKRSKPYVLTPKTTQTQKRPTIRSERAV